MGEKEKEEEDGFSLFPHSYIHTLPAFFFLFCFSYFFFFFSKWGWRLLLSLSRARRFGLSLLKRFRTEGNGGSNWLCYIHSGAGFFFVGQEESFKAFFFFFQLFLGGNLDLAGSVSVGR